MIESHLKMLPCILVTGANGFLGSEIVRQAIAAHLHMCATDKASASIVPNEDFRPADILDPRTLNPVFRDVSIVIHTAGLAHVFEKTKASKAPFQAVNEFGTANVARAAAEAGVRHFVLASSVSVYGSFTQGLYDESTLCHPEGPYAESKYMAEQRATEIAQQAGMALTILRLATLYGESDPGNMARLMRSLDRGRFIWVGDGSNRKSLLYKGDAARACLVVAERPASSVEIYNVSAPPCTMRDIVDGLAHALGRRPLPGGIPASLAGFISKWLSLLPNKRLSRLRDTIEKWLVEDVYDTSRFKRAFGFQAKVSLTEGLRREVDWHRQSQHGRATR